MERLEIGDWRLEIGEIGDWGLEIGDWRLDRLESSISNLSNLSNGDWTLERF